MVFSWIWSWLLGIRKPWIRAITKTVKFKREIEHSENKIVNYFKTRLGVHQSSSQKAWNLLEFSKPSEWKFRIVIQKCRYLSSLLMTRHSEIKILPLLYWIPSTVLMLSPNVLNTLHSTEAIPLYWCYPHTVLNNLHSTEATPHMYCCYPPTVLKVSLHSTEYPPQYWCYPPQYWCYPPHVLILSPRCTEQPPMYWTNLHSTEPTLYGVIFKQSRFHHQAFQVSQIWA